MGKLRDLAIGYDWEKIPNEARIEMLEADSEIERLRAALRDVIGMLDDPTGSEHVRDMRGATLIARAALKEGEF